MVAIITVHLLLLLWLVTRPPAERPVRDRGRNLVLISVSDGERAAGPPVVPKTPPPIPVPAPEVNIPLAVPYQAEVQSPSPAAMDAPQASDVGGCALAARTADAIAKDPAAMAELAALPPAYRTLADAVILWNGEWVASAPGSIDSPAILSIRHVLEQVAIEASPECRDEPIVGPQFIAIPEQNRTTTLVIGSGVWQWSDLLATSAACSATTPNTCLPLSSAP
ncbi:MAG: hypothetical protein ABIQ98_07145 [Sphingomicrobium sp.]